MSIFLLKVEDIFSIKNRGLILLPRIPIETDLPKDAKVSIIRPDGSKLKTEAFFDIPFYSFAKIEDRITHKNAYECVLKGLEKESVPIGSKIWLD